jgi:(p)ppGpp synthase/HD superfamily hydrolase
MLTKRFEDAFAFAAECHRSQLRKGGPIAYIAHPMAVSSIVLDNGGVEDEAIAALLHDAPEDQGGLATLEQIRVRFGDKVAEIVRQCSDSLEADPTKKAPWKERKSEYIRHLAEVTDGSVLLVSAADKLHNLRVTSFDYAAAGEAVWKNFKAGRDDQLWYYESLTAIYQRAAERRIAPIADELDLLVRDIAGVAVPVTPGSCRTGFRFARQVAGSMP